MSADVIKFPTPAEALDELEQINRAINTTRDTLKSFKPKERLSILSQIYASTLCEIGDDQASGSLASAWLGWGLRDIVTEINKVYPPSCEEGMR
jgi:hypothetical protein